MDKYIERRVFDAGAFGVQIADSTADAVISAVCSVLVMFGIVSDPTTGKGFLDVADDETETESSADETDVQ